jgi:hypothetical protein
MAKCARQGHLRHPRLSEISLSCTFAGVRLYIYLYLHSMQTSQWKRFKIGNLKKLQFKNSLNIPKGKSESENRGCVWCLTPLSTIFPLKHGPRSALLKEETTDLPQVTYKLYYIMLYRVHLDERDSNSQRHSGDRHWLHR